MLHRTDYMSIIFQKKQGGASAMKSETSDVQREKQEFLAPKYSSIPPRPRLKTARANR